MTFNVRIHSTIENGKPLKAVASVTMDGMYGKESNIAFLKDEYGTGGHSDAIPGSGLWESHDAKGITIATLGVGKDAEKKSYLITWSAAEKRIGELITVGRYLNSAEKEKYPSYHKKQEERTQRDAIAQEFRSVITDFNDYEEQLGEKSKLVDRFVMSECANAFVQGEKDCGFGTEKHYTLPTMRELLSKVISENTHLTERAEKVLEQLGSEIAYPLEPTYDELNPPPEPEKEYKFSLGDTVFIGTHEYEILSLDGDTVQLFDSEFPLFTQEMPKAEFEAKAKENPLNDKYLVAVDTPTEKPVENAVDNTVDRITVDRDAEQVKWIYYNPDSTAGGSYICCELDFDVFEEVLAEHLKDGHIDDIQKFVGEIEEMSDQYWSDRDTFDFENTEADYFAECDYEGFSEDTIQFIHEDIEKYNASKVRIDAGKSNEPYVLDRVLKALKIFDIRMQ